MYRYLYTDIYIYNWKESVTMGKLKEINSQCQRTVKNDYKETDT